MSRPSDRAINGEWTHSLLGRIRKYNAKDILVGYQK